MSLRKKLIRLAYEQPQLRGDLLPLITKKAAETFDEWVKDRKFPNPNPKRRNKIKFKSLPKEQQKTIREDWTKAKEKADAEKEAKKPASWKAFDKMLKTLEPDVAESLPSPDEMDEHGEGDNLKEKYEIWLEQNDWAKQFGSHGEYEFSDAHIIGDWIDEHASKWEKETSKEESEEKEEPKKKEKDDKKQQGGGKTKVEKIDGKETYSTPQTKEIIKAVADTVSKLLDSGLGSSSDKKILRIIVKDSLGEKASQEEMLDDLDERIDFYKKNKKKRPDLIKALKKLSDVIESKSTYDPDKKEEKSFADKKKEYEEKIKNSKGMSQKEKDAALKKLDKMSEEDLDKSLSSMGKGRKNKGKATNESEEESSGRKASLRFSLTRLAYEQPQLRKDLLPLINKSARKYQISFQLTIGIRGLDGKETWKPQMEKNEQMIHSIIKRNFKGNSSQYHYHLDTQVEVAPPSGSLHISNRDGSPISGTMFNNDWRDVIQALVKERYLLMRDFQDGIALAMRQKAYLSDA